jgi:uncharacterized membrane protein YbaN (DUF454 family)
MVAFRQNASAMGPLWLLDFVVPYLAALTAYRVLMTWVYARTQSLLLAMLMHASYTSSLIVDFPTTSVAQGLAWQAAFAALLWTAVAVVMAIDGRQAPSPMERKTPIADTMRA